MLGLFSKNFKNNKRRPVLNRTPLVLVAYHNLADFVRNHEHIISNLGYEKDAATPAPSRSARLPNPWAVCRRSFVFNTIDTVPPA